jgi:hypothetical protein
MEQAKQCAVVGYGHMGKKISEILRQLGCEILLIDPNLKAFPHQALYSPDVKTYTAIDELLMENNSNANARNVKAWFICTPTATHFQIFSKIINALPGAKIMIEKPLCSKEQLNEFDFFKVSHPLKVRNVCINNHYIDCENLKNASSFLRENNFSCRKISIDFCKDRLPDVVTGRYIDEDFMIWGYEGFHMLHIAAQLILNKEEVEAFINMQGRFRYFKGNDKQISWVAEYGKLETGLVVLLRTATDGSVFSPTFQKSILKRQQRMRRVNASLNNGIGLSLTFAESRSRGFSAEQDYYFGWQSCQEKHGYWKHDNPLKKHIENFLAREEIGSALAQGYFILKRRCNVSRPYLQYRSA